MTHFNEKYSLQLRKKVISYYRTHTARECAQNFGLSHGQIIGLMETSRRKGLIGPKFKDRRVKTPWDLKELLFVIRHAGVQPRSWIGSKLGRGGARVIKERLKTFNSGTKWMNGMPRKWAVELWGLDIPAGIKTKAGPTGGTRGDFKFIIIPWTDCLKLSRTRQTAPNVKAMIRSMAKFQLWIHSAKDSDAVKRKLKRGLK